MKLVLVLPLITLTACGSYDDDAGAPVDDPVTLPSMTADPFASLTNGIEDQLPVAVTTRLDTLFEVANGDALETMVAIARHLVSPVEAGFTFVSTSSVAHNQPARDLYNCPLGGTVETLASLPFATDVLSEALSDECAFGSLVVSGEFRISRPIDQLNGTFYTITETDSYLLTDSRNESTTTMDHGTVGFITGSDATTPNIPDVWGASNLTMTRPVGSYRIDPAAYVTNERNSSGRTTTIDRLIDSLGNNSLVRTTNAFQRSSDADNVTYSRGVIAVTDEDDDGYILDADSGDADTFQLTVRDNGVTTSYQVKWSARFGFDAPDPASVDLGFGSVLPRIE